MSRLNRAATQEAIRNLTDSICDDTFDPTFEALLERIVAEPDRAIRECLSEKLATVVSLWVSSAADIAVELSSQVVGMGRTDVTRMATEAPCQPAGGPPDAA